MPGLLLYFFSIGIIGAPLNRFTLFSTTVGKGTASAVMSFIIMAVDALGIECANFLYNSHNNKILGLYCLFVGCIFGVLLLYLKKFLANSDCQ